MKALKTKEEWALEQLKLESADPAEILRFIQKEDFVLNENCFEAVSVLFQLDPDNESSRFSALNDLRTEINEFSDAYFDYSLDEREDIYSLLIERCKDFPEVKPRLHELQKGLLIDSSQISGNKAADFILKTFLLPMNKKQEKINELNKMTVVEKRSFKYDLKKLKTRAPNICQLMPYLSKKRATQKSKRKNTGPAVSPYKSSTQPEQSNVSGWVIAIVAFVAIKFFILLGSSSGGSSNPPPTMDAEKMKEIQKILKNGQRDNFNNEREKILNDKQFPKQPTIPGPTFPTIPSPSGPKLPQTPSIPSPQPSFPGPGFK
jgi:hypothetical protein